MTVFIAIPSPAVGPGYTLTCTTDFIGPIEAGSAWGVVINPPGQPENIAEFAFQPSATIIPGVAQGVPLFTAETFPFGISQGQPVELTVGLFDPRNQQIDTGTFTGPLNWDAAGMLYAYQGQGQNGLTQQEHGWLDTIQQAVQRAFNDLAGGVLESPIGELLAHPDSRFLETAGECVTVTGDGVLNLQPVPGIYGTYGVIINIESVPPGFGMLAGVVPKYFQRVVELAAVYQTGDGSLEYIGEFRDVYQTATIWLWQTFAPKRVQYSVTPGCVVSLCVLAASG
jgi:hypothetical protein